MKYEFLVNQSYFILLTSYFISMTTSTVTTPASLDTKDSKTITSKSKSNFSSSFFFLPVEKRKAMERVYAFFRVIDDVVDEVENPNLQRELLDSWKRELAKTYEGLTIVPLLKELKESIDRFKIPKDYFLKLIEGCEMDITKKRYETFDELYEYCYRVASMVGLVCMKIFEYESPTSTESAVSLGLALQLTNIIRDVGTDLEKGRIYLPAEDLKRFNVSESDLKQSRESENFLKLMEFQYQRALNYYEKGFSEFSKDREKKLLAARIMGTVYRRILKKIKKQNYPVLNKKVKLHFFEKVRILVSILISNYFK